METITSHDGTSIAYHRLGEGPPLVLVHGLGAANPIVWPATRLLAEHFTVVAPDRRGRRDSGDGPDYALEREFEDIATLVDTFEVPTYLLGHSFGGMLALGSARLTENLQRLILYEPGINPPPGVDGTFADRLQALLEAGDNEQIMLTVFSAGDALDPDELQGLRSSPSWADRVASAPTVPREVRAGIHYQFNPHQYNDFNTPTLLLVGENSPGFSHRATELARDALSESRIVELPDQHHLAMYTAPELFLKEVLAFVDASK
jgi:pimeloyl-ACP methyl ester carboxylesterase